MTMINRATKFQRLGLQNLNQQSSESRARISRWGKRSWSPAKKNMQGVENLDGSCNQTALRKMAIAGCCPNHPWFIVESMRIKESESHRQAMAISPSPHQLVTAAPNPPSIAAFIAATCSIDWTSGCTAWKCNPFGTWCPFRISMVCIGVGLAAPQVLYLSLVGIPHHKAVMIHRASIRTWSSTNDCYFTVLMSLCHWVNVDMYRTIGIIRFDLWFPSELS